MKTKLGISLIYLAITVIVLGILSTITVISFNSLIRDSQLTNFNENMNNINDAVGTYYISVGMLPKKTETAYTFAQVKALVQSDRRTEFTKEVEINGDLSSAFYLVDIQKIGITQGLYNISQTNNNLFMNDSGTIVYYIEGVRISGIYHFSYGE